MGQLGTIKHSRRTVIEMIAITATVPRIEPKVTPNFSSTGARKENIMYIYAAETMNK